MGIQTSEANRNWSWWATGLRETAARRNEESPEMDRESLRDGGLEVVGGVGDSKGNGLEEQQEAAVVR